MVDAAAEGIRDSPSMEGSAEGSAEASAEGSAVAKGSVETDSDVARFSLLSLSGIEVGDSFSIGTSTKLALLLSAIGGTCPVLLVSLIYIGQVFIL
jgi:hypothetical protein